MRYTNPRTHSLTRLHGQNNKLQLIETPINDMLNNRFLLCGEMLLSAPRPPKFKTEHSPMRRSVKPSSQRPNRLDKTVLSRCVGGCELGIRRVRNKCAFDVAGTTIQRVVTLDYCALYEYSYLLTTRQYRRVMELRTLYT